jgi:hypothetical protein
LIRTLSTVDDYTFIDNPRKNQRGRGVSIVCKSALMPRRSLNCSYTSFESLNITAELDYPMTMSVVYRPPRGDFSCFIDEFGEMLSMLSLNSTPLIIIGDFNIDLNITSTRASAFLELLNMFNLNQQVTCSTHKLGGILDLIISSTNVNTIEIKNQSAAISDHYLLAFSAKKFLSKPVSNTKVLREYRDTSSIDFDAYRKDLSVEISRTWDGKTADMSGMNLINNAMLSCLNKHAPIKSHWVTPRPLSRWFTPTLLNLKRKRRQCERKLKKARTAGHNAIEIDLLESEYRRATNDYLYKNRAARCQHSMKVVEQAKCKPSALFNLFSSISKHKVEIKSNLTADEISDYFITKVNKIRSSITSDYKYNSEEVGNSPAFKTFKVLTEQEVLLYIHASRKTNSPSDIIPTNVTIESITPVLPYLTDTINQSLVSGTLPEEFKHAVVRPILKGSNPDPNEVSNYRPVSLLPFLAKVLERIVAKEIMEHMNVNQIGESRESGYKSCHSTETALLKATDDLRRNPDRGQVSILAILDLSAAFDTIDHSRLIDRLSSQLGLDDAALSWFRSYITNRSQSVFSSI